MPQIFSGWVFSRLNLKTGNKSELNILNTYPEVYFQSSQASAMELFLRKYLTVNTAIIRSSRLVVFSKKRCSHKLCKIHKKTPALESLFQWGFKSTEFKLIKERYSGTCFLVNSAKFLKTSFLKNLRSWVFPQKNTIVDVRPGSKYASVSSHWKV